jgi:hypothetical protein
MRIHVPIILMVGIIQHGTILASSVIFAPTPNLNACYLLF